MHVYNPGQVAEQLNEMEFKELEPFNEGSSGVFWGETSEWSPWEMHPDSDELLHVIEGAIKLEVLPDEGEAIAVVQMRSGDFITIPKGKWHRQKLLIKTKEYYLTPGPTLHSHSLDPRQD